MEESVQFVWVVGMKEFRESEARFALALDPHHLDQPLGLPVPAHQVFRLVLNLHSLIPEVLRYR